MYIKKEDILFSWVVSKGLRFVHTHIPEVGKQLHTICGQKKSLSRLALKK
jgi:hypothetical protein